MAKTRVQFNGKPLVGSVSSADAAQLAMEFGDKVSFIPVEEDRARQEDKRKTSIDFLIRQFSVKPDVVSGSQDFTVQYQDHVQARAEVNAAYRRMPEEIRNRYRDMDAVFEAVRSGELKIEAIPEEIPEAEVVIEDAPKPPVS